MPRRLCRARAIQLRRVPRLQFLTFSERWVGSRGWSGMPWRDRQSCSLNDEILPQKAQEDPCRLEFNHRRGTVSSVIPVVKALCEYTNQLLAGESTEFQQYIFQPALAAVPAAMTHPVAPHHENPAHRISHPTAVPLSFATRRSSAAPACRKALAPAS